MSPTARSLKALRALGYQCQVVEQTIPRTFIKRDLFGVDVIGLKPGSPVLAIQCTSGSHHAARRAKLVAHGFMDLWKGAGAVLEVWSWEKHGPRGQRKVWQLAVNSVFGRLAAEGERPRAVDVPERFSQTTTVSLFEGGGSG